MNPANPSTDVEHVVADRSSPPLTGIDVFELPLDPAGQYAGRLLAALGAAVTKIEPLEGDPCRWLVPMWHDRNGRARSIPFEYLNAGKRSIAVDLEDDSWIEVLGPLIGSESVLIAGPTMASRALNTGAGVVVVASAYGMPASADDLPTTVFTRFHSGGSGYLIPAGSKPGRPTTPGTLVGECFAGAGIAVAGLSAVLARMLSRNTANGGRIVVDFSSQAHMVFLEKMFMSRALAGQTPTRATHRYPFGGAVQCKDGLVSMLLYEDHQWAGLCRMIGREDWINDERFSGGAGRWDMQDVISDALNAWCSNRLVDEVVRTGTQNAVPIGRIATLEQVLARPSLRSREFLREEPSDLGAIVSMGLPFGNIDPRWNFQHLSGAPSLGEHTRPTLESLGYSHESILEFENLSVVLCGPQIGEAR